MSSTASCAAPGGRLRPDRTRLALAATLLAALALRAVDLTATGLWIDEANGVLTAERSLAGLLENLRLDSSPPLFYLLLHAWIALFGDSPLALRLLPVLCGTALVAATAWAGREFASSRVGLVAALYVAVSPVQVHYSQKVRMYALLPLLALVATVLLVRTLRTRSLRDEAGWLIATTLALYTHNFAVHLLPAQALLIVGSGALRREPVRFLRAAAIGALAYAPWLPTALAQLGNGDHYAWFLPYWQAWGAGGVLQRSLLSLSPGGEYVIVAGLRRLGDLWHGVLTLVCIVLAAFGIWRRVAGRPVRALALDVWPLVLFAVPLLSATALSVLGLPSFVPGRVDQMGLPAFALLVAAGLCAIEWAWLRVGLLVALVAVGTFSSLALRPVHGDVGWVREGTRERRFRVEGSEAQLAEAIAARWQPGDVVVFTSLVRAPVAYYLRRAGIDGPFVSFPRDTARHLGSQNDARLLADRGALAREAAAVVARARALAAGGGRIFVVRSLAAVNAPLSDRALEVRFGLARVADLGAYAQEGVNAVAQLHVFRDRKKP